VRFQSINPSNSVATISQIQFHIMNALKIAKIVAGSVCAWISFFFCTAVLYNGGLTVLCAIMLDVDRGPVDHYWNCGLVIHGVQFFVAVAASVIFWFLAKVLLRVNWSGVPASQVSLIWELFDRENWKR